METLQRMLEVLEDIKIGVIQAVILLRYCFDIPHQVSLKYHRRMGLRAHWKQYNRRARKRLWRFTLVMPFII
jgi:hypothetical protein